MFSKMGIAVSKKTKKYKECEVDIEARTVTINGFTYDTNGVPSFQDEEDDRRRMYPGANEYKWPAYRDD